MAEKQAEDGERMTHGPDRISERQAGRGFADERGRMTSPDTQKIRAGAACTLCALSPGERACHQARDGCASRDISQESHSLLVLGANRIRPKMSNTHVLGGQPSS